MYLYTPDSLLYPITVTQLLRREGDEIEVDAPLFVYQYTTTVQEYDQFERKEKDVQRKGFSNFECEIEGNIASLNIKVGQTLTRPTLVADVTEACKHEVQFGGICANCAKDVTMTNSYNTTIKDASRATINTVHGRTELLISANEASKADLETKQKLLKTRKLSLVVDLDQTIIHATVDPTVAEWQKDESSPNHQAVKDVQAFQLADDAPNFRNTWYYIKLRPGLKDFLQNMSEIYELHIYTMGTRAYAENIAKIIDPERKIFGDRVLSRDESGSQTVKNLKRLFPVDTKMVVIIDDRADVWHWIPNLVKVPLYDFFVGIGDINGSFLPKRPEVEAVKKTQDESTSDTTSTDNEKSDHPASTESNGADAKPPAWNGNAVVDQLVSMAGKQDAGSLKEQSEEQDQNLTAQLETRPLLQMQQKLEAAEEEAKASPAVEAVGELLAGNGNSVPDAPVDPTPPAKYRQNLLQDDDKELIHLGDKLRKIHAAYFAEYDKDDIGSKGGRIAELRTGADHNKKRSIDELTYIPDVAPIMASLKSNVLAGINLVFSGVIPLGSDVQNYDTALWAKTFGATISENITKRTTHVVGSPDRRTAKVRAAAKRSRIWIVSQAWLLACFSQWKRVDESPFRIHMEHHTNGAGGLPESLAEKNYLLSSSDSEAAQTGDETEDGGIRPSVTNGLSLDTDLDTDTELEKYAPKTDRADSSPAEDESPDQWGEMDEELREFLGSDVDDDESSDTDSVDFSTPDAALQLKTPPSHLKRKRGITQSDGDSETSGGEDSGGSRLQRRKRKAMARTSSLTNVRAAASNASTPARDNSVADPGGGDEEIDDEDLEAMLAAELERQSDEEDAAVETAAAAAKDETRDTEVEVTAADG